MSKLLARVQLTLFFMTCMTFAQTASRSASSTGLVIWEPPVWNFLEEYPKATVAKEMVTSVRVSNLLVSLEIPRCKMQHRLLGERLGAEEMQATPIHGFATTALIQLGVGCCG